MPENNTEDPDYQWAEVHAADFERYLREQCRPDFEGSLADEYIRLVAPMLWTVSYVIQRTTKDNGPVNTDDSEMLIERSIALFGHITRRKNPIFIEILNKFLVPMAEAMNIVRDSRAITDDICRKIGHIVQLLQDGETCFIKHLTESGYITLEIKPSKEDIPR